MKTDSPETIIETCPCCGCFKTKDRVWHFPEGPETTLSPEESEKFYKKIEDGLKHPVGPVPTPRIGRAHKIIKELKPD